MHTDNGVKARHVGCVAFAALLLLVTASANTLAAVSFSPITWGSGGDTLGWFTTNYVSMTGLPTDSQLSTASSPATGGNPGTGGYLAMTFPVTLAALEELLVTDNAALTGDFVADAVDGVTFDWLGQPGSAVALYLLSGFGGGSAWGYSFGSTPSAWTAQNVSFGGAGWTLLGGAGVFASALTDVTLIGLQVLSPASPGDPLLYGLDNWQFYQLSNVGAVPEPGEWAMIGAVLLSAAPLARSLRRRAAMAAG